MARFKLVIFDNSLAVSYSATTFLLPFEILFFGNKRVKGLKIDISSELTFASMHIVENTVLWFWTIM